MMQNVRESPSVLAAFVRNTFCSEATSSRALSQNDNSSPYHEVSFNPIQAGGANFLDLIAL